MSRESITSEIYDSVIIGGGIVGSGLFREQSLHNIKVLLLDQADFNSQTSQGSSKMLHGGIRYLEQLDFFLVFEALKEKNLWLKLAPNLTKEIPLYLPVYKHSKWPLFALKLGLLFYDLLSLFKNSPHKVFNKSDTLKKLPGLNDTDLKGCGMYYDGIVDDAKLGLECIYDGLVSENSQAKNYKKVYKIETLPNDYFNIYYKDTLNGEEESVISKTVQFATGPFTDKTISALNIPWSPVILPSKGSHIWLKKDALELTSSMVLQTKDNRIIFVIPSRNSILVGTTEVIQKEGEETLNIKPSKEEVEYLIACLNQYFPIANIKRADVLSSFAAIRPLVRAGSSSAKTSRNHKIFSPQKNMFVLVGGKYTTFRKMAEHLNSKVFKILNIKHNKSLTLKPLRKASLIQNPFKESIDENKLKEIMKQEMVRTSEDLLLRRLSLPTLSHIDKEDQRENLAKSLKTCTQDLPEV